MVGPEHRRPRRSHATTHEVSNVTDTNPRAKHARRAFTILEVMIVLIIIGLIGSIVAFNVVGAAKEARRKQTEASMRTIEAALKMYHGRYGSYPQGIGIGGVEVLVVENLLEAGSVQDGWGREFQYYSPTMSDADYELISLGDDGIESDDDIVFYPGHQ